MLSSFFFTCPLPVVLDRIVTHYYISFLLYTHPLCHWETALRVLDDSALSTIAEACLREREGSSFVELHFGNADAQDVRAKVVLFLLREYKHRHDRKHVEELTRIFEGWGSTMHILTPCIHTSNLDACIHLFHLLGVDLTRLYLFHRLTRQASATTLLYLQCKVEDLRKEQQCHRLWKRHSAKPITPEFLVASIVDDHLNIAQFPEERQYAYLPVLEQLYTLLKSKIREKVCAAYIIRDVYDLDIIIEQLDDQHLRDVHKSMMGNLRTLVKDI